MNEAKQSASNELKKTCTRVLYYTVLVCPICFAQHWDL